MAKRTFWFGIGATVGASAGFWTKHRLDKKLRNSTPLQIGLEAVVGTRDLARKTLSALGAGLVEVKVTQAKLRSEILRIEPPK